MQGRMYVLVSEWWRRKERNTSVGVFPRLSKEDANIHGRASDGGLSPGILTSHREFDIIKTSSIKRFLRGGSLWWERPQCHNWVRGATLHLAELSLRFEDEVEAELAAIEAKCRTVKLTQRLDVVKAVYRQNRWYNFSTPALPTLSSLYQKYCARLFLLSMEIIIL